MSKVGQVLTIAALTYALSGSGVGETAPSKVDTENSPKHTAAQIIGNEAIQQSFNDSCTRLTNAEVGARIETTLAPDTAQYRAATVAIIVGDAPGTLGTGYLIRENGELKVVTAEHVVTTDRGSEKCFEFYFRGANLRLFPSDIFFPETVDNGDALMRYTITGDGAGVLEATITRGEIEPLTRRIDYVPRYNDPIVIPDIYSGSYNIGRIIGPTIATPRGGKTNNLYLLLEIPNIPGQQATCQPGNSGAPLMLLERDRAGNQRASTKPIGFLSAVYDPGHVPDGILINIAHNLGYRYRADATYCLATPDLRDRSQRQFITQFFRNSRRK